MATRGWTRGFRLAVSAATVLVLEVAGTAAPLGAQVAPTSTTTSTTTTSTSTPPTSTTTSTSTTPTSATSTSATSTTTTTTADPPAARPRASATTATIVVNKAGIRTSSTTVAPLAGALFGVYASQANAVADTGRLATCTTGLDGRCSMDLAGGRTVFVREVSAPPGYVRIDSMSTGTSTTTGDNTTSAPYIEQLTIQNNNTYTVPAAQALQGGGSAPRSFANALINPQVSPACGLNVAMVFDVSASINATEMTQMKSAARTMVMGLTGTPSQIAMYSFGTNAPAAGAPANLPLTPVASGNAPLMTYINGLPANPSTTGNRTNWDAGLFQVAQSTAHYDLVLMLTDGNPTVWGDGIMATGSATTGQVVRAAVEAAVASANAVKAEGSQILAIGIGPAGSLPRDNLSAISSDDDVFLTGFDELADLLAQIATEACHGTITIVKEAKANTATNFSPAGGWTFSSSNGTVSPSSGVTAPVTGAVNFGVDFSASQTPQTITFDETLQPGWDLVQQGGLNAQCTTNGLTATRSSLNVGPTGFRVTVGPNDIVSCLVRNQQRPLPRLTLVKQVTNDNGGTAVPTAWTLQATGPTTISGATGSTAVTDAVVPEGTYNLSESGGPGGYAAGAWSCTGATSSTATSVTLGVNDTATCTITNDDQPAHLTLIKTVVNTFGSASPTDWTLHATGPTTLSGVTGSTDVTNAAVDAGNYEIFESGGPAGYVSGAWTCTTNLRGLFRTAESLTINNGEAVTCTLTNVDTTAQLTLVKTVVNDDGGSAAPTDWTLGADGPEILSGATGSPDVTAVQVPTGTYTLSETGPSGYAASGWDCTGAAVSTATSVTLDIGESATCTITNDDIAPQLTLTKTVVNDDGGTALDTDWTLHASGPTTLSGATGTAAVTNATVLPGSYDLSETGPGGYAASDWTCTGDGTQTGSSVALALGQSATCNIVNDDIPARLTLVKTVVNDNGGTAVPTDWTLTATGTESEISGQTGSGSVTDVGVLPGTYALSESGPAGYAASTWSCVGGTQLDATITVQLGESATCTINNDDLAAQLVIAKTSTALDVSPGAQVPYTITVANTGPVVATNVVVTDTLPVGLTFVSSAPACTAAGQTLTCALGDIDVGASVSIALVTRAADPFPAAGIVGGQIVNRAVVTGSNSNCVAGSDDPACRDEVALPPGATTGTEGNGNGGTGTEGTGNANGGDAAAGAPGTSTTGGLPFTGADVGVLALAAVAALCTGSLLVAPHRRRLRRAR